MKIEVHNSKAELGRAAASRAAQLINGAIEARGHAYLIAATGASQFEFLDALQEATGIDWGKTTFFHLDEYVGLPETHPASFRKYLRERIVDRLHPHAFHFVEGDAADPAAECRRLGELISRQRIDAAFVGIGENGHLAFNDPPADFETTEAYILVDLDEACRRQQLGEGWFKSLEEVPRRAISMSINQILASRSIICVVPDARKAQAVADCLSGEVSPLHPASVLQRHQETVVYLDSASAALLPQSMLSP